MIKNQVKKNFKNEGRVIMFKKYSRRFSRIKINIRKLFSNKRKKFKRLILIILILSLAISLVSGLKTISASENQKWNGEVSRIPIERIVDKPIYEVEFVRNNPGTGDTPGPPVIPGANGFTVSGPPRSTPRRGVMGNPQPMRPQPGRWFRQGYGNKAKSTTTDTSNFYEQGSLKNQESYESCPLDTPLPTKMSSKLKSKDIMKSLPKSKKYSFNLDSSAAREEIQSVWKDPNARKDALDGVDKYSKGQLLLRNTADGQLKELPKKWLKSRLKFGKTRILYIPGVNNQPDKIVGIIRRKKLDLFLDKLTTTNPFQ